MKPDVSSLTSSLPIAAVCANFKKFSRGLRLAKHMSVELSPGQRPVLVKRLDEKDLEVLQSRNWVRFVCEDRQCMEEELGLLQEFFSKTSFPVAVSFTPGYRWVSDEDGYKSKVLKFEFFAKIAAATQLTGFEQVAQLLAQPIVEGY